MKYGKRHKNVLPQKTAGIPWTEEWWIAPTCERYSEHNEAIHLPKHYSTQVRLYSRSQVQMCNPYQMF